MGKVASITSITSIASIACGDAGVSSTDSLSRGEFLERYPSALCAAYDRCGWSAPGCIEEVREELDEASRALAHFRASCGGEHLRYFSETACDVIDSANACDLPCAFFSGDRPAGEKCQVETQIGLFDDCANELACRWASEELGETCQVACP